MSVTDVILKVVDVLFAVAETVVKVSDKRRDKRAKERARASLTLKDLMALKRADDEYLRRSQAPTVVIPPPSERERQKPR
jgi:hypothetical protein